MIGVYLVSVFSEDHDRLMNTLIQNLDLDQMPFVIKSKYDTTSCQVVLYEEQVMMLKLAIPTVMITRLTIEDEIVIPFKDSTIG